MVWLYVAAAWLTFSSLVAHLAIKKKRFGFGYFLFSVIFTPFVGFALISSLKKKKKKKVEGTVRKAVKSREEREFDAEWKVLSAHDKKIRSSMDYIERCLYGTPALRKAQNELKAYYKATKSSAGLSKAAKRIVQDLTV